MFWYSTWLCIQTLPRRLMTLININIVKSVKSRGMDGLGIPTVWSIRRWGSYNIPTCAQLYGRWVWLWKHQLTTVRFREAPCWFYYVMISPFLYGFSNGIHLANGTCISKTHVHGTSNNYIITRWYFEPPDYPQHDWQEMDIFPNVPMQK